MGWHGLEEARVELVELVAKLGASHIMWKKAKWEKRREGLHSSKEYADDQNI